MSEPFAQLPGHWSLSRIDRVASVNARIGWKALTADEYQLDGYIFLSTPNIKGDKVDFENVNYISTYRYEESPELKLEIGDVLLVKDGNTLGITNLIVDLPRPATVNSSIAVIRPFGVHPGFLRYVLASRPSQERISAMKGGMGVPHLFQWDIKRLPIPLPPLDEQLWITSLLDAENARIDALIAKKRHLIELLNSRVKYSIAQQVLGSTRQPFHASKSGFYASVPLGWAETQLRHLGCEVQTGPFGSQLHADDYVEDGWPVVNPMNLVDGGIQAFPGMSITGEKRAELERHILSIDDIVFGRRGEMGRAGLVSAKQVGWLCGTGSIRLRIHGQSILPAYLKLLVESPPAKAYFELASVGSTMDNLNSEILLSFPALVPPLEEQAITVTKVAALDKESESVREKLERQIRLFVEHRQALITAAVTGELPVPEYVR